MTKPKSRYIGALDIGTSKIACFIAHISDDGQLKIIGIGHQKSKGIKSGTITSIKNAEYTICEAVNAAEEMAEINLDKVIVNISGSKQISHNINTHMDILPNQEINLRDIEKLNSTGCKKLINSDSDVIHCIELDYSIDRNKGITDPINMFGKKLGVNIHAVTGCSTSITNLANCLARCHLDADYYISTPYASALACLNDNEKKLGCLLMEFGGGNTTISAFKNNKLTHIETIPVGGIHITNDIAMGASITTKDAERIKTLHGRLFDNNANDIIDIYENSSYEQQHSEINNIQLSTLTNIIKPRIEEIMEMIKNRIEKSQLDQISQNIVITGGASQLTDLKEYASTYLNKNIRIGTPLNIEGLAESTKGPAFSTCVGMLQYYKSQLLYNKKNYRNRIGIPNRFSHLVSWLKDNF